MCIVTKQIKQFTCQQWVTLLHILFHKLLFLLSICKHKAIKYIISIMMENDKRWRDQQTTRTYPPICEFKCRENIWLQTSGVQRKYYCILCYCYLFKRNVYCFLLLLWFACGLHQMFLNCVVILFDSTQKQQMRNASK